MAQTILSETPRPMISENPVHRMLLWCSQIPCFAFRKDSKDTWVHCQSSLSVMTSTQKAIFTSGPLSQNKQPSQQFQSYGASGSPAPIAEARIIMFNSAPNSLFKQALVFIWGLIIAIITQATTSITALPFALPESLQTFDMFPRPNLVITVKGKISDTNKRSLQLAGFSAQTNGRYQYWSGPPTDNAVKAAISVGVVTDAFAPGNSVSVDGLIAFSIINRLIHYALIVLANLHHLTDLDTNALPVLGGLDLSYRLTETNLLELPDKGYFFGYFDGLILPDRANSLRILSRHFSLLLGKNVQMVETMRVLTSGWLSLNDTPAGRGISHLLYCIDHAIELGISVRPVFLGGIYAGCVFNTSSCGVIVGNTFVKPTDKTAMAEAIGMMQSHDSALLEIVNTIASCDPMYDDVPDITVSSITCARDIHDQLRRRNIPAPVQQKLLLLFRKLRFSEQLWETTNPRHVSAAIEMICRKEWPSRDIPINLRLDAMWTKKPIYSVLAAFNVRAPSLRGSDSTLSIPLHKNMYTTVTKPGKLLGIPIFAKAHDKALEDWEGVLADKHVWFSHKGADKMGTLRIRDQSLAITFDTPEAKSIIANLGTLSLKRGRDEEVEVSVPSPDEIERQAQAKRRRLKGYGMIGLGFGAFGPTETAEMDAEEEEVDPFL